MAFDTYGRNPTNQSSLSMRAPGVVGPMEKTRMSSNRDNYFDATATLKERRKKRKKKGIRAQLNDLVKKYSSSSGMRPRRQSVTQRSRQVKSPQRTGIHGPSNKLDQAMKSSGYAY